MYPGLIIFLGVPNPSRMVRGAPEEYITNSEHTNPMVGYHGPHNVPHNIMASLVVPRSLKHISSPHHSCVIQSMQNSCCSKKKLPFQVNGDNYCLRAVFDYFKNLEVLGPGLLLKRTCSVDIPAIASYFSCVVFSNQYQPINWWTTFGMNPMRLSISCQTSSLYTPIASNCPQSPDFSSPIRSCDNGRSLQPWQPEDHPGASGMLMLGTPPMVISLDHVESKSGKVSSAKNQTYLTQTTWMSKLGAQTGLKVTNVEPTQKAFGAQRIFQAF